jgi:hypothetical protein
MVVGHEELVKQHQETRGWLKALFAVVITVGLVNVIVTMMASKTMNVVSPASASQGVANGR